MNKGLDAALERFATWVLEESYPYLVLDARYEKLRIDGVIRSQAVLIAIGINIMAVSDAAAGGVNEMIAYQHPEAGEMDAYERVLRLVRWPAKPLIPMM